MSAPLEIKAEYDDHSMGKTRDHYVFPTGFKKGYERAAYPIITGSVWIKKGEAIPDSILITFKQRNEVS